MTTITEKAVLGQKIIFTATLERVKKGNRRTWKENECKERTGILVGSRTLWEGDVEGEELSEENGGGYAKWFNPTKPVPAYLVAFALNRKPILIPQHAAAAA